jgi:hypothetical protein
LHCVLPATLRGDSNLGLGCRSSDVLPFTATKQIRKYEKFKRNKKHKNQLLTKSGVAASTGYSNDRVPGQIFGLFLDGLVI